MSGKAKGYRLVDKINEKGGIPMRKEMVIENLPQAYGIIKEMHLSAEG